MAPKQSLQQYSLDAKEAKQHKRKKIVSRKKMEETPEKVAVDEQEVQLETDSPQTPSTKKISTKPSAKRTKSSSTSTRKKLKSTVQPSPRSSTASKDKAKVPDSEPTPPISWFNNQENFGKWVDWFHTKPVGFCDMVDQQLLDEMPLLQESGCHKLLNPGMDSYPRLTRLFYLNLKGVHQEDGIGLETLVAGIKITLTHKIMRKILGLEAHCPTQSQPSRADCIARAKSEFLLPNHGNVRQLTLSYLKMQAKVVFWILVRCIVPRESSKELITDKLLHLMFLIFTGCKVDIPSLLAEHMLRAISSTRNTHLPYSNLLPLIFREFNIPLDNEEKVSTGPALIDFKTLQKLDIVKTPDGEWKFIRDLTDDERKSISNLKLKGSQNAPSASNFNEELNDIIKSLQRDIIETRELMIDIANRNLLLVGQVDFLLEKTAYLEDLIRHGQHADTDVPESSKQNAPSSPTDDPIKPNEDDIDTAPNNSPLSSLARFATSIIEDTVTAMHKDEVAVTDEVDPEQQTTEQGKEELDSVQQPQEPSEIDQIAPSADNAAMADAFEVATDPSSSSDPPTN